MSVREYAEAWLIHRDLEDRTRDLYARLLRNHVFPTFGPVPVPDVTPAAVRTWHAALSEHTGPTARAHAYALLRTVMHTAVADDVISANPCRVRGAGQTKRVKKIVPATLAELEALTTEMPERYQLLVLFAAWCGLRFGELAELRRSDLDVTNGVVDIRNRYERPWRRRFRRPHRRWWSGVWPVYGATVRDRGAGSEAGWAGRSCSVG